jgi:hypothetical protein
MYKIVGKKMLQICVFVSFSLENHFLQKEITAIRVLQEFVKYKEKIQDYTIMYGR